MKYSPEESMDSVWACLLHLAYKYGPPLVSQNSTSILLTINCQSHLKILIHRNSFLRLESTTPGSQIVLKAACRISRIAEDMSSQGTLRYGQMHL